MARVEAADLVARAEVAGPAVAAVAADQVALAVPVAAEDLAGAAVQEATTSVWRRRHSWPLREMSSGRRAWMLTKLELIRKRQGRDPAPGPVVARHLFPRQESRSISNSRARYCM